MSEPDPPEDAIENLMSMGFDRSRVVRALRRYPAQEARAVEWLLEGGGGKIMCNMCNFTHIKHSYQ